MSAETINGARIVLETLHRLGVTDMFGYPGGAVIPIYDEIYSFTEIKHYFVRHEQGAAHARLMDMLAYPVKLAYAVPHLALALRIL